MPRSRDRRPTRPRKTITRTEAHRIVDEVMQSPLPQQPTWGTAKLRRSQQYKIEIRQMKAFEPLRLFLPLLDRAGKLSGNAWKVVCYVFGYQCYVAERQRRRRGEIWSGYLAPVPISLAEFISGIKDWRNHGLILAKSSLAKAINEAVASGLVLRERRSNPRGGPATTLYTISVPRSSGSSHAGPG